MKNLTLVLFFTLASSSVFAQSMIGQERCFATHIKEAIEINKERREKYRHLYGDGPAKVMSRLIMFEKLILISANWYDLRARKYHRHDIPILCHDLVPMDLTPEFSFTKVPAAIKLPEIDFQKLKKELKKNLKRSNPNLEKADRLLVDALNVLKEEPRAFCLSRHFLESMLRAVRLIPHYEKHFSKLNMNDDLEINIRPERLSLGFLNTHLIGFGEMERIDRKAFIYQRQGIPLLCQDVPHIPTNEYLDYNY